MAPGLTPGQPDRVIDVIDERSVSCSGPLERKRRRQIDMALNDGGGSPA